MMDTTHPSLVTGVTTGTGLGTLDTYTMECIVFPETSTLIPIPGTLPPLLGPDRSPGLVYP